MKNWKQHWPYAVGIICFFYVLLRAHFIPLTYDEIWTIDSLNSKSLKDIFSYTGLGSNSHLLNSLFVWLIQTNADWIPLEEPLLYRVPNVLAFGIYAGFSILMIRRLRNGWIQLMAAMLCFCNPFLLEFFSLARGYGMALACTAASLYYLERAVSTFTLDAINRPDAINRRLYYLSLTWASLGVLANFTWLNYYLALLPVLAGLEWVKQRSFSRQFLIGLGVTSLVLAAIIIQPIIKLRLGDELWYGGQTGLVYDTFTSLILGIMGFKTADFPAHLVLGGIGLLLLLIFLEHVRKGQSPGNLLLSGVGVYLVLFVLLSSSSLLQNLLFHTPFLVNRTALVFLLPLVWLLLKGCESSMERKTWQTASVGLVVLCAAALINFIRLANIRYSYSWPFDAKTEEVLNYLNEEGQKRQEKIHLDHSWIINVSIEHVGKKNHYPWVEVVAREPDSIRSAKTDYYYLYNNRREYSGYNAYQSVPDSYIRDTALYYPEQDLLLLKIRK